MSTGPMKGGLRGFAPTVTVEPRQSTTAQLINAMRAEAVGKRIADCHMEGSAVVIVLETGAQLRFAVPGGGRFSGVMH